MRKVHFSLIISFLFIFNLHAKASAFNQDSAYHYIQVLSEDIGPRPMGSHSELTALHWALGKLKSFGADTAYIMPFSQVKTPRRAINTLSGITIGIFKGVTDSTIIVGAHIDSDGPEIPGANDNASGTATMLEIARIWSKKARHYTMVFCAFGGEERGLVGSRYFVDNYPGLDKVSLMISTDMGGSSSEINMMFETDSLQAPKWLVRDAFNIAEDQKLNRLTYPTHYSTLNSVSKGGSGSDHMPFINKGIPAIDFTSGMSDSPIHTPQDKMDLIDINALGEYGNYVNALIVNYQSNGIKENVDSKFLLWEFLDRPFFIPYPVLTMTVFIALILSVIAFFYGRKNRLLLNKTERIRFTGLKLLFMFFIIFLFSQFGELIIQAIKGLRYPWYTSINLYIWYAFLWMVFGFWIVLQLTRKWKFSPDAYVYIKRYLLILMLFTFLAALLKNRLGFYPALSLLLLSIAVLIKNKTIQVFFQVLAPLPMFRLFFNEALPFMGKFMINGGFAMNSSFKSMIFSLILISLLLVWFLPFLYGFGQIVAVNPLIRKKIKSFRQPLFGIGIIIVLSGFGIYLGSRPAYDEIWKPSIRVTASFNQSNQQTKLIISGNEYFKDVTVSGDTSFSMLDTRENQKKLPALFRADWIQPDGFANCSTGPKDTIQFDWDFVALYPAQKTTVELKADSGQIDILNLNCLFDQSEEGIQIVYFGDRLDTMKLSGICTIEPGKRVVRNVKSEFARIPVNIEVHSELATVRYRTEVTRTDTIMFSGKSKQNDMAVLQ